MLAYARDFAGSIYARKFPCKFPVVYRGGPIRSSIGCTCKRTRARAAIGPVERGNTQSRAAPSTPACVSSVAQPFLTFCANEANGCTNKSQRQNHSKNNV